MSCYGCKYNLCVRSCELYSGYFTPGEVWDVSEVCYTCDECKHFDGDYRKKSTKYGLTVYLCGDRFHRNGPQAAHRYRETAQRLHEYGQRKFTREQNATTGMRWKRQVPR